MSLDEQQSSGLSVDVKRTPHELWTIFESAQDLPTLPEVIVRLQKMVDDPRIGARDLVKLIEQDPAISTKVLKVVNSVFYSPANGVEITHLQPAIARLGFLAVVNIALTTSVFAAFARSRTPVFDRKEFWKHSVCVGIVSSVLYDYTADIIEQPLSKDTVHLAGIIHDIGKILFECYANNEFHQAITNAQNEEVSLVKEECRVIGMGHDEVGAWLGEKWKLAQELQAVLRWHHDPMACPDLETQPLAKLVHMADYICHSQQLGDSGNPHPNYDHRVGEELKLTTDNIGEVMGLVREETEKSTILLSLMG